MKEYKASSIAELEAILADAGPGILYRGQTKHYGEPASPSVTTSFDRLGCIPDEMGKWSYYASDLLEGWFGEKARSQEFSQAVLQHYGWRSFYIDVSSSPAVAAWFASHKYSEKFEIDMTEDCFESAVWLRKKHARYDFEEGEGYLYLIRKPADIDHVNAVDLSSVDIKGARPRASAQAAWLLGPLRHGPLPSTLYLGKVIADRALLRDFAAKNSLDSLESLFPTRREDPILDSLLCLPWAEILGLDKLGDTLPSIPAFRRTIEFPEYDDDFRKHLPAHIALYRHGKISQMELGSDAPKMVYFQVPELAIFGTAQPTATQFPRILKLVEKHQFVGFEVDQLINHIQQIRKPTYGKGVSVTRDSEGLFIVAELVVDHPGMEMVGAGINRGWYYAVDAEGNWTRQTHPEECPCKNDFVHQRHMSALTIIEEWLGHPEAFGIAS